MDVHVVFVRAGRGQGKALNKFEFVVGLVKKAETSHRRVPEISPFGGTLVAKLAVEGSPLACCTPSTSQVNGMASPSVADEARGLHSWRITANSLKKQSSYSRRVVVFQFGDWT